MRNSNFLSSSILFLMLNPITSMMLNCQFIDMEFCVSPACQQLCKAVGLIITKQNQTITNIFTNIQEINQIKVLKMHDQIVHQMPVNLENFFPQLNVLQIWSCGLRILVQNDISVFENLKELSVSGNEIEILPSNLFNKNSKLTKIDFSRNNLKHVGFNLLLPLENLYFADFYQNFCINDGSRNNRISELIKNLRLNCKSTIEMLTFDITGLNEEVKMLKIDVKACERVHKSRRCGDNYDRERFIAGLDTLFPSIIVDNGNGVDGF